MTLLYGDGLTARSVQHCQHVTQNRPNVDFVGTRGKEMHFESLSLSFFHRDAFSFYSRVRPTKSTLPHTTEPMTHDPTPRIRGSRWRALRARWLRHHPLCVRCLAIGRVTAAQEVDHVVPLFKGGPDKWDNLQSLCRLCHVDKTCEDKGIFRIAETGLDGWPVEGTGSRARR